MSLSQSLEALPVELQLTLIGILPLTALIKMRGMSNYWRALIQANLDKPHVVHPTRRALLFVWEAFISRPSFLKSRQYTLPFIKPFDREAYISKLPTGTPLAFEMWIREWPSSAVIGWIWPGLDGKSFEDGLWSWWRTNHTNQLSVEDGGPIVVRLALEKSNFFGCDSVDAIRILKRLYDDDDDDRDVMLALDHENEEYCWSVVASCKDARDVGFGTFKSSATYPTWTAFLYEYIIWIDHQYHKTRNIQADLKIIGHQWKLVGELDGVEADEADDPLYPDAGKGPKFRVNWYMTTNGEYVLFCCCPKAPGDMGGTDLDWSHWYDRGDMDINELDWRNGWFDEEDWEGVEDWKETEHAWKWDGVEDWEDA